MCTKFEALKTKIEKVIKVFMKFSPCKNAQGKKVKVQVLDLHYRYQPSILSSPKQHLHKWKLPTKSRALGVYHSKKTWTSNHFHRLSKWPMDEVMNLDYRYEPSFLSSPKRQLHWWKLCDKSQALKPSHSEKSTTSSLSILSVWFLPWMKCWIWTWDFSNSFYHLACIHSIYSSHVTSLRHWKGFLPKFCHHLHCHFPFCWWENTKLTFSTFQPWPLQLIWWYTSCHTPMGMLPAKCQLLEVYRSKVIRHIKIRTSHEVGKVQILDFSSSMFQTLILLS